MHEKLPQAKVAHKYCCFPKHYSAPPEEIYSHQYRRNEACHCHLNHNKSDLLIKVQKLEKVAAELNRKLHGLKNSRLYAQEKNKSLLKQSDKLVEEIRQKNECRERSARFREQISCEAENWSKIWQSECGKKILADKQLMENAQQVKIIEKQVEYNQRLIQHKRRLIGSWQNNIVQKVHKDDQLVIEQENKQTEKKMIEWLNENKRLLGIYEAMKDSEVEMIFTADRCLQRNRKAREEYSEMQANLLLISRNLDERSVLSNTNSSSSSITLHSEKNHAKKASN